MAKDEDSVRDSEEAIGIPDPDVDATDARNLPAERGAIEPAADPAAGAPATKRRGDTRDAYEQVKHTRSASLWSGLVGGAVILLVLLAFIVQNQQNTQITLLFWEANLPLGVSLLIAAILGALLVGSAGGLRILQLRRAAKKLRD
ncbi:LapA family protein [Tsukamurella ocularis]|uniref:LapA family protein n=1 Tax=Tsukamurella ocularis TaxID=1970234 RepID=UPI002169D83B|nr:lipopolysaccharide assembly protein LapA domain-containing protein [Tsukamurella ocularis]MCS3780261.1 putative integral membrane protein [Tsukamurella ocularis]MCS3786184.1 putative integral membrane protein [Tsukamurella ocularis]MCS3849548.1 putative integral membrane protein [Tsukamurella ocularis]